MIILSSFAATFSVHAAPKILPPARVVAENPNINVLRGGQIQVTLKGIERHNNILRYEILSQPRHGKLSSFIPADKNRQSSASVTYTHNDDDNSLEDHFTYRVTAPISKQSATGEVTVRIADIPPALGAPDRLEFAAIVGESHSRSLQLSNIGGGVLHGKVRVNPPFYISNSNDFAIPRNASTNITVTFSPQSVGLAEPTKIQPSPQESPNTFITFVAEANAPFAVKSTTSELRLKSDDSRETEVELVNLSANPQDITLTFQPPLSIEAPASIKLSPHASTNVRLFLPPSERSGELHFSAIFRTAAHSESRSLTAPPVPPRLIVHTPEIDFRNAYEATFNVENSGGTVGYFEISFPDGISTVEGARSFTVQPGKQISIHLLLGKIEDLETPELLYSTSKNSEPLHIPILLPQSASAKPAQQQSVHPSTPTTTQSTASAVSPLAMITPPGPTTPHAIAREVLSRHSASFHLFIPLNPATTTFRLERLGMTTATNSLPNAPNYPQFVPIKHPGVAEITSVNETKLKDAIAADLTISIDGLEPSTGSIWRVVPEVSDSSASPPPTSEFVIRTLPSWSFPWRSLWFALAFAILAYILYLRWKSRRPPV